MILRSSAHAHPQWRNCGGGRRSAQIEEILTRGGYSWNDTFDHPRPSRWGLLQSFLRLRFTQPRIKVGLDRGLMRHLAGDYLRYRWYFQQPSSPKVFLVEECIDYGRMRAAWDTGTGMICLPHNLEIWQRPTPDDFYSGEGLPHSLHREAFFTSLGDVVFCISREEQWFFTNYGANADFLPYHPPATEVARLRPIREARMAAAPGANEFFAITSASNQKNREGLIALAGLLAQMLPGRNFHLHVGGYQTTDLRDLFPADRCSFHGELEEGKVGELMRRCQGAIVYQTSGVGALTRIPELLCAGIPVLANAHAARSAQHLSGVHLFHDGPELLALAGTALPMPPMPQPDRAAEQRLLSWVARLAAGSLRTRPQ